MFFSVVLFFYFFFWNGKLHFSDTWIEKTGWRDSAVGRPCQNATHAFIHTNKTHMRSWKWLSCNFLRQRGTLTHTFCLMSFLGPLSKTSRVWGHMHKHVCVFTHTLVCTVAHTHTQSHTSTHTSCKDSHLDSSFNKSSCKFNYLP